MKPPKTSLAAVLRRHGATLALCVLAVCAVVWVVVDSGSVSTSEAERRKKNLFPAWRHDDVTKLLVELPEAKYELVRKPKGASERYWDLTVDGVTFAAEEQIVDRLLGTLEYATFTREVPTSAVDRAAFGLAPPRARFTIHMGTLVFDLAVGGPATSGESVYVEVQGRGVFVVAASLVQALQVSPAELRTRDFVPYFSTDLASLHLDGEGGTRVFERAPWSGGRGSGFRFGPTMTGRAGKRVDATRLDQVLVALGRMQAQVFLEEAQAKASSRPRVTLTLTPRLGEPAVIGVGGDCPDKKGLVVAVRSSPTPLAVCVPESVLASLVRPVEDFDDDGLVGATSDEISELEIKQGDRVLDLARTGTAFRLRRPEARDVTAELGGAFLDDLVYARGTLVPDDTPLGDGDRIRVRIVSVGGITREGENEERVEELEIGPASAGRRVALRKEDGAKIEIGEVAAGPFTASDLALKDAAVLSLAADDIHGMTIVEGARKQRFERDGAAWQLTEPKGKGLACDALFARDAVQVFAKLRAHRWVGSRVEPSFGLGEPRLRVTAHLSEGASSDPKGREVVLLVGARTDDGAYGQIVGKDEVFVLPRRVEDAVSRLFVSRMEFFVAPEAMSEITIEGSERKLTFVRDGKQLKLAGAGGTAREAEVVDALAKLVPHAAVAVGAPDSSHGLGRPAAVLRITLKRGPDDPPDAAVRTTITLGASTTWDGNAAYFAWKDGIEATYVVPDEAVKKILGALGVR